MPNKVKVKVKYKVFKKMFSLMKVHHTMSCVPETCASTEIVCVSISTCIFEMTERSGILSSNDFSEQINSYRFPSNGVEMMH